MNFAEYVDALHTQEIAASSARRWKRYFLLLRVAGVLLMLGGFFDGIHVAYSNGPTQSFLADVVAFLVGKFFFEQNDAKARTVDAVDPPVGSTGTPPTRA